MTARKPRMSAAQRDRIVRAAMQFAKPWMVDGYPHPVLQRHRHGLTATLVRACAAAERSTKKAIARRGK